jgi:hypothetical protein
MDPLISTTITIDALAPCLRILWRKSPPLTLIFPLELNAAALVLGERFHKKSLDEEKIKKQIKNAENEISQENTGDDKKKPLKMKKENKKRGE